MKRTPFALLLVGLLMPMALPAVAQTEDDIALYSRNAPTVTARALGMGNAVGVLGADHTSVSENPASIAMFRQSDIGFSLGLGLDQRQTTYLSRESRKPAMFASFNNLGAVLTLRQADPQKLTGWQAINFGVSYNRLNDYTAYSVAAAHNPNDSYADMLASIANKLGLTSDNLNPTSAYSNYNPHMVTAWGAHIIDEIVTDPVNNYVRIVSPLGLSETVWQEFRARQRGDMSEWAFTVGTNIAHKLYAGATIAIPVLSRTLERTYEEQNDTPIKTTDFNNYAILHKLKETGAGVNAKLGLIYSISRYLRLGVAMHTPSILLINYKENLSAQANFIGKSQYSAESPQYTGQYSIITPLRGNASMGIIFGQYGMLTADYSVDLYPLTRIAYGDDGIGLADELIPNFQPVQNVNAGIEILAGGLAFRGGIGGSTSPYKQDATQELQKIKYFATGGIGLATSNFYFDLAYRYLSESGTRYIYDFTNDEGVNTRYNASILGKNHQLMLSFGFRL